MGKEFKSLSDEIGGYSVFTWHIKEFIKINEQELQRLFNLNSEDQSDGAIQRRREISNFKKFMKDKAGPKLITK